MSKSCYCVGILFALAAFAVVGAGSANPAESARPKTEEQIVLRDIPQTGPEGKQERKDVPHYLKDIDIKRLVAVDTTALIDVTTMTQSDAVDAITAAGLKVAEIGYDYSDTVPAGSVMKQIPAANTPVEVGSDVKLVVAQTEIAIEPYRLPVGGEEGAEPKYVCVEKIVHRPFDAQLGGGEIRNVPIFSIMSDGTHENLEDTDYRLLEMRAKSIAKNLTVAWGMMDKGARLRIVAADKSDDIARWHVRGPFAPEYPGDVDAANPDEVSMEQWVHIDVVHDRYQLRIMTVFPLDAVSYGSPLKGDKDGNKFTREPLSTKEVAEYLVALIEGHHLLFSKMSNQTDAYEKLQISKTREGRVFLGICRQVLSLGQSFGRADLRDVMTNMSPGLLERLDRLARSAPTDWRVRDDYGALSY